MSQQQPPPPAPPGTAGSPFPPGVPAPGGPPPPGFAPPPANAQVPAPPATGFVPSVGAAAAPTAPGQPPTLVGGIPVSKQPLNMTPSRTVYVSNLNEKVKLQVLKNTLRNLFKQYGEVLDVVAHGNIRMRGQAFVAYPDEECAAKAIKELQHFVLYTKPMVLQYARDRSDVHAKIDGEYDDHFQRRMTRKEERRMMPLPGSHKPTFNPMGNAAGAGGAASQKIPDEYLPPNAILFLQNLPETITQQYLVELFQRYPGFKEVRMVPTKRSIAFVEYETEIQSAIAKTELAGHPIDTEHLMSVTFARK
ncbi:hypothetical protein DFQ28_010305 [Apophysomyces sp. BC1034]|nr:hypothetical protein DFQ30_009965 [Apophysomyces sp. BC1015]KAG0171434.1 hypothetical protein DFQ29_008836 [Apophysomyces sp. BC1021]KAG0184868.1 hypothetical protein DFQ28_010305 [Apophysomyces sp. BC1034]